MVAADRHGLIPDLGLVRHCEQIADEATGEDEAEFRKQKRHRSGRPIPKWFICRTHYAAKFRSVSRRECGHCPIPLRVLMSGRVILSR
jgi:hypothetical protein